MFVETRTSWKTIEHAWGKQREEPAKPWKTIEHAWGKHREEAAKPWKTIEHAWGNMVKTLQMQHENVRLHAHFKQEASSNLKMQTGFIILRLFFWYFI